jgi:hypothetical protein
MRRLLLAIGATSLLLACNPDSITTLKRVGGATADLCGSKREYSYDPATNTWTDVQTGEVFDTDPAAPCNAPPPGPGGGINPNNTWISGDVVITTSAIEALSSPIYDEATGMDQTNFTTSVTENLHVDAGYGDGGQTIVNTSFTDPVDPATSANIQVTNADLNADVLTESNSQNEQIQDVSASNASAETPMDIVGSTQNGDVTAGAIVDLVDTTTIQSAGLTTASAGSYRTALANAAAKAERGSTQTVSLSGAELKVELLKTNVLQITDWS